MEDLELMRYITIGQYLPTGSFLHRLDSRAKILGIGVFIIAIVLNPSVTGLLYALLFVLALIVMAKVSISLALGGLRPALPVLLLIVVLQVLFGWSLLPGAACQVLWSAWIFRISNCALLSVFSMLLRLTALILLTGLLTMTSTISELTHAIENLLRPFRRLGLPAHELAMVFTIAIRFVPTLTEELEKLLKAQAARGADIRLGANPIQRVRQLLPALVPLFLTTLRRGEWLAEAMEARGYSGSQNRSSYVRLKFTLQDALALVLLAIILIGLFWLPFLAIDRAILHFLVL